MSTEQPIIATQTALLRENSHLRDQLRAWQEVAERLAEYSNPRATKGIEYAETMQRLYALKSKG